MTDTLPKTMRAAAIDRFGGAGLLRVREVPVPTIDSDEVLLKVGAADIAKWDTEEREGHLAELQKQMFGANAPFPYVLGSDGAGTVAAVGNAVTTVSVGEKVYGSAFLNPKGGFYAEYVAVKAIHVAPVPKGLSIEQAGVLGGDALTALDGLDRTLHVRAGETVLIFGASGGLGHFAVQLAKRLGAKVFAVASGEKGKALARRLGADHAIDGKSEDIAAAAKVFAPDGFDAMLLTAGGAGADAALTALKTAGRAAHPEGVQPVPKAPAGANLQTYNGEPNPALSKKLNELIAAGPFHVEIAKTFSLDDLPAAHAMLKTSFLGKLALKV